MIGTHVMVTATGTNEFCSNACHSMQWVAKEYAQSGHHLNRTGVIATCHDCHIPHHYPELLWYKAKAGIKDAIGEVRGVISTEEKFKKERLRMAKSVWAEYKENNSANCQHCHAFTRRDRGEAEGLRAADAPAGAGEGCDVHRLPQGHRPHGAGRETLARSGPSSAAFGNALLRPRRARERIETPLVRGFTGVANDGAGERRHSKPTDLAWRL